MNMEQRFQLKEIISKYDRKNPSAVGRSLWLQSVGINETSFLNNLHYEGSPTVFSSELISAAEKHQNLKWVLSLLAKSMDEEDQNVINSILRPIKNANLGLKTNFPEE